jgi:hypothetical protein
MLQNINYQIGGDNEPLIVIYIGEQYSKITLPEEEDRYYALTNIKFNHPIEFYTDNDSTRYSNLAQKATTKKDKEAQKEKKKKYYYRNC